MSQAAPSPARGLLGVRLGPALRQALTEAELRTFLPAAPLVAAFHLVVACLMWWAALPIVYPWVESLGFFVRYAIGVGIGGSYVLLALLLHDFAAVVRGRAPPVDLAGRIEGFFRLWLAGLPGAVLFVWMLLGNANLKPAIPVLNPANYDAAIEAVERAMFLGVLPTEWMISGTSQATYAFWDFVYGLFGTFIVVSLAIAVHHEGMRGGARCLTAVSVGYILCAFCALLLPSLGPVYVHPSWFAPFDDTRNAALVELLARRAALSSESPEQRFVVSGIAAMPSFHVCSCWALSVRRVPPAGEGDRVATGAGEGA